MGQKKKFPGFFLLIFGFIIFLFVMQSYSTAQLGKVSFSHQVEHLINLGLVKPEENRQTAQSETLTTFSGRFQDNISETSEDRYSYLAALSQSHELQREQVDLVSEMASLKEDVIDASQFFLQISSLPLPSQGYSIVSFTYNTADLSSEVTINTLPSSLPPITREQVSRQLLEVGKNNAQVDQVGRQLRQLIQLFRSPRLGVGVESIKSDLREMEEKVEKSLHLSVEEKITAYRSVFQKLDSVIQLLSQEKDGVKLASLRSVRNYLDGIERYKELEGQIEKNQALLTRARTKVTDVTWYFNNQQLSTRSLEKQDPEIYATWFAQAQQEWVSFGQNKGLAFKAVNQPRTPVLEKTFTSEEEPSINYFFKYLFTFLPALGILFVLWYVFARQMKGAGNNAMNFGKSPARLLNKDQNKVVFKDVAGADEAKEELEEIVDFLKDPQKFTALGAEIPKGVLLVGPPGTGKTLVAKAVAGEADRPFFSISGSDFVEMFVGVGASRIRDMFDQARKNAPCIIFIDEIDAVGRHRGAGIGGGHDEREQTLNQLLVEMDGFDTREGVILMAATNRPDILDRALLRPGRFDRRVVLDLPDIKGRFEILKVHARKIKIDASVDLMDIARATPGASGADLKNVLNEAALLAARKGRTAVTTVEAKEACDKVRYGKERRSLEMDQNEKLTTAFHESGHAIVGLAVEHADPVDKVTIIPRGFSLGATHFMPKKNRLSYWRKELIDQLAVLMGGRVAEELFVGDMSSGAQHDIAQATKLARAMVCEWGMTETLGLVALGERSESNQYLGGGSVSEKGYSEETAKKIDSEVKRLVDDAHTRAVEILTEHKDKVQLMTDMLLEFETLEAIDVQKIMDNSWNIEDKRARQKSAEELRKKSPPPAPPKREVSPQTMDLPSNPQNA